MNNNQNNPQDNVPQSEQIYILKKDWPPFPKGTEFKIKKGLADEMLHSPTFGEVMPNGQKANGMIPRHWTEYIKHFEHVGGFDDWFDKKYKTESERLQSRIAELEAENKALRGQEGKSFISFIQSTELSQKDKDLVKGVFYEWVSP